MDQHHLFETLVSLGVLDQADERREAGTGGQQVEVLARSQVAQHQRAGRLAADDDLVTDRQVLQLRGQRAVGHLDAEEFEVFVVIGAGDAVGAGQRTALLRQADHHELTIDEAQAGIAGGAKAEQGIVPVMNRKDALGGIVAHRFDQVGLLTGNRIPSCYICKTDFLNKLYLQNRYAIQLAPDRGLCRGGPARECFACRRRPVDVAVGDQHGARRTRTTYDTQLFDRFGKTLRLNELGQALLPQAVELIERAAAIASVLEGRAGYGQLRIGATLTIGNYLATLIVADFLKRHPESTLQLKVDNTTTIIDQVARHELDLGLIEGTAATPNWSR
jgi:hypothetical protein